MADAPAVVVLATASKGSPYLCGLGFRDHGLCFNYRKDPCNRASNVIAYPFNGSPGKYLFACVQCQGTLMNVFGRFLHMDCDGDHDCDRWDPYGSTFEARLLEVDGVQRVQIFCVACEAEAEEAEAEEAEADCGDSDYVPE